MGRKIDVAAKRFFRDRKIISEICGKFVFRGRRRVDPDSLLELPTEQLPAVLSGEGGTGRHRDCVSLCAAYTDEETRYLILGLEFQRRIDRTMPVRVMEYDARQYLKELADGHNPPRPVSTLVVNLSGRRWTGPTTLHGVLGGVPDDLKGVVSDYSMTVFDPHTMDGNMLDGFCKKLRYVVNCLRLSGDAEALEEYICRKEAGYGVPVDAAELLDACLNLRLEIEEDKEEVDMCVAVETWRKHDIAKGMSLGRAEGISEGRAEGISVGRAEGISVGRAEGRAEGISVGRAEGRAEGKRSVVESALRENLNPELIQRLTGLSLKEIEQIRKTCSVGQRN